MPVEAHAAVVSSVAALQPVELERHVLPRLQLLAPVTGDLVPVGHVVVEWEVPAEFIGICEGHFFKQRPGPVDGSGVLAAPEWDVEVMVHTGSLGPVVAGRVSWCGKYATLTIDSPATVVLRVSLCVLGPLQPCNSTRMRTPAAAPVAASPMLHDFAVFDVTPSSVDAPTFAPVRDESATFFPSRAHSGQHHQETRQRVGVTFVGSTRMDGQKQVFLSQAALLPRDEFDVQYVSLSSSETTGPLVEALARLDVPFAVGKLRIPAAVPEHVLADPTGFLVRCLAAAEYEVDAVVPPFARDFWRTLHDSIYEHTSTNVLVYGNSDVASDAVVAALGVLLHVPVVVDLPNPHAGLFPGHTALVAPSRATAATAEAFQQQLRQAGVSSAPALYHLQRTSAEDVWRAAGAQVDRVDAKATTGGGLPDPSPVAVIHPGTNFTRFQLRHPHRTRRRRLAHVHPRCVRGTA